MPPFTYTVIDMHDSIVRKADPELQWKCCGGELEGDRPSCGNPSNETFTAPEPSKLSEYKMPTSSSTSSETSTLSSINPIATLTGTPTQVPVSSPTTVTTLSSTSPQDSALTVGTKAGIGVGTAVAVLLLVAMIAMGLICRRRSNRNGESNHLHSGSSPSKLTRAKLERAELEEGTTIVPELDPVSHGTPRTHELPGETVRDWS